MKNRNINILLSLAIICAMTFISPMQAMAQEDIAQTQSEAALEDTGTQDSSSESGGESQQEVTEQENQSQQDTEVKEDAAQQVTDSQEEQLQQDVEAQTTDMQQEESEIYTQSEDLETMAASGLISYSGHQQTYGNLSAVNDGASLGTTGTAKRLEAITVSKGTGLSGTTGHIMYQIHGQTYGTQDWRQDGELAGSEGQAKRVEAIRMYLTGDLATKYDIYYRVHMQTYGWLNWAKGGTSADTANWAGSQAFAKRVEAFQIVLVAKGASPSTTSPANTIGVSYANSLSAGTITYSGHQQTYGNLSAVSDGSQLGTIGKAKRLEAIQVSYQSNSQTLRGGITYQVHAQTYGWMNPVSDSALAGTEGQSKRLEAVKINLTGELAEIYDIYYRVHAQTYGWMEWKKNGELAGTTGESKRLEAIQIKLVRKDSAAPSEELPKYSIMGTSSITEAQMVADFKKYSNGYPSTTYASKGADTIEKFVGFIYKEATVEGVKPEVVYAQAMLETGYLQFGNDVKAEQCNFCGLGATGGVPGNSFATVQIGLRAQVQHLKAYASNDSLVQTCVDERFIYVTRNSAPYVEWLGTKENPEGKGWATSAGYGSSILAIINKL